MTRDEQIFNEACRASTEEFAKLETPTVIPCFIAGAKWADKNNDRTRAVLYLEHRCQDLDAKLAIATDALKGFKRLYFAGNHVHDVSRDALARIEELGKTDEK